MTDIVSLSGAEPERAGSPSAIQLRTMRADDIPAGLRLCRQVIGTRWLGTGGLFLSLSPAGCACRR